MCCAWQALCSFSRTYIVRGFLFLHTFSSILNLSFKISNGGKVFPLCSDQVAVWERRYSLEGFVGCEEWTGRVSTPDNTPGAGVTAHRVAVFPAARGPWANQEVSFPAVQPFPPSSSFLLVEKDQFALHGTVKSSLCWASLLSVGLCKWLSGKESACQCGKCGFSPWVGKIPWRREWQPTPVFVPVKSHGWRSLAGYSPWGSQESDTTERLRTHHCLWYWVTPPALGQGAPSQCVPLTPSFSSSQVHSSQGTFSWEMNTIFREPATRLSQSMEKQIEDDSTILSLLIKILVYTWRNINCFLLKADWLECRIENGSDAELNKKQYGG